MILEHNTEYGYASLLVCDYHGEYPLQGVARCIYDPYEVDQVMQALNVTDVNLTMTTSMVFKDLSSRYNGYYDDHARLMLVRGNPQQINQVYEDLASQLMGGPRGADDDTFDYWPGAFDMLYVMAQDLIAIGHHPDYTFATFVRVIDSAIALEGPPSEWEADFLDENLMRLKELLDESKEA